MDLYLRAADLVVGKPGGITVAEALACGRPLLATRSLGGQEGFNVDFLERNGVGGLVGDREVAERVDALAAGSRSAAAYATACVVARSPRRRSTNRRDRRAARRRDPRAVDAIAHEARRINGRARRWVSSIAWYYRRHSLRTLGPVLYLGQARYRGPELRFEDGTLLRDNDPIGRLHFNNASIAALGEGSMQRVGFRFARLMRESLRTAGAGGSVGSVAARHRRVPGPDVAARARRSGRIRQYAAAEDLEDAAAGGALPIVDVGVRAGGAHSRTRQRGAATVLADARGIDTQSREAEVLRLR